LTAIFQLLKLSQFSIFSVFNFRIITFFNFAEVFPHFRSPNGRSTRQQHKVSF
jgi:hypothetical protein